jgi:TonB-linked SusC/RagA family outer membrane protein
MAYYAFTKPVTCPPPRRRLAWAIHAMTLTTLFLLASCFQSKAEGLPQQTITFRGNNVSLENVFAAVKKQTGYRFFFNSDLLKGAQRVSIDVRNAPIEEVMNVCLINQPFTYTIKGRTIFIIKKEVALNVENMPLLAVATDPITVSGRVTDDKGEPLAGANVRIRGTNKGLTTDKDGGFKFTDIASNAILEISFVGYETQTVLVRGKSFINIAMGQKLSILDETVVIAYGTTTRRFTTGNIATVKAADIEKQPVQNPLLALQGRVPGVEITQLTGLSGGGVKVRIQGQNSIESGLDPLIVIDGVPYPSQLAAGFVLESIVQQGSPLNYINPSDIESIDVLKDADATAIYGSRAANGAILITTKKGKAGRTKLTITLQQGLGRVAKKMDMLNTRQYLDMRYEAFRNDGLDFVSPTIVANDLKVWDTTRYTNWQKELIGGKAWYTNANAGISGGNTAVQYLVGASYRRQSTVFPGSFDDKSGDVHFSINGASPNQRLRMQFSGSYMYDVNHLPQTDLTQQAILLEPNAPPLYKPDGSLNWATNASGNSTWTNPLSYTISTDFFNTTKNLVSNAQLSYRLLDGLELRSSFGYTNLQSELYLPNRLESLQPEARQFNSRTAMFANRSMSSWIIEPQLQYFRKFGNSKIDGFLGATIQKSNFTYLSLFGSGFAADLLMKTMRAATSLNVNQSGSGITRFNAAFGRLNYSWKDKYLLNLNARRDGSNKFGDKNRFHDFWSVGAGWIFSEEEWARQGLAVLGFGKIRASYGITGNDQIPDFSYLPVYSINNPSILYQNNIGFTISKIPNPYLQWEVTRKFQVGLDLGFMHDRVLVGATYSRNRSSNQLIGYVLPSFTGFTEITKNLPALIQNTSWEFTLNTTNFQTKTITWKSSANLTIPHNKLVSFPGIELTNYALGLSGVIVGQPLGVFKAVRYAGVSPATGAYMMLDKNGNAMPSSNARDVLISPLPAYYGGLLNTLTYKRFQLDFLFQFMRRKGTRDMYFYNGAAYPGQFFPGSSNQPVTVLDRWQKPGDNTAIARYATFNIGTAPITNGDVLYTYDASYIRLKNVSLSWQLPDKLFGKGHMHSGQLFFQGQNLWTLTNYMGLDPETMSISTLPPLQQWTVGLKLDL